MREIVMCIEEMLDCCEVSFDRNDNYYDFEVIEWEGREISYSKCDI